MHLSSPAFQHNGIIPKKFTCDGEDISPELLISNAPESAKSLALIVDDPDAPGGTWTHWTVWNIDPKTAVIKEESVSPGLPADSAFVAEATSAKEAAEAKVGAVEGITSFGRTGYGGPCPPPGKPHRYFFKLYAFDVLLHLAPGASKSELEAKVVKHTVAYAELVGLYGREGSGRP